MSGSEQRSLMVTPSLATRSAFVGKSNASWLFPPNAARGGSNPRYTDPMRFRTGRFKVLSAVGSDLPQALALDQCCWRAGEFPLGVAPEPTEQIVSGLRRTERLRLSNTRSAPEARGRLGC